MMLVLFSNFFDRFFFIVFMEDVEIRFFVLEIFISFIDRYGNRYKFFIIR